MSLSLGTDRAQSARRTMLLLSRMVCAGLITALGYAPASALTARTNDAAGEKRVIGAIATVEETESDILFTARVDTGATTTSVHVEEWVIEDESEEMAENVGKTIRFRIKNRRGESEWIERRIAEVGLIKTSEEMERRYKVRLTLKFDDVKKKVLVSLNDRSHMRYPLLIGRNFLDGDFLVDVAIKKSRR